ncbi:MAG: hypothetical protein AABP62_09515 [Planctomycetota bacterium]
MQDLQLRDRLLVHAVDVFPDPRLPFEDFRRNRVGNPAVTLTQQPDEVRPAAFDLFQAEGEYFAPLRLLFSDAPAQINLAPSHTALFAESAKLRKDFQNQLIPLSLHVTECGRDEDTDDSTEC